MEKTYRIMIVRDELAETEELVGYFNDEDIAFEDIKRFIYAVVNTEVSKRIEKNEYEDVMEYVGENISFRVSSRFKIHYPDYCTAINEDKFNGVLYAVVSDKYAVNERYELAAYAEEMDAYDAIMRLNGRFNTECEEGKPFRYQKVYPLVIYATNEDGDEPFYMRLDYEYMKDWLNQQL